jgi:hypothetical protein
MKGGDNQYKAAGHHRSCRRSAAATFPPGVDGEGGSHRELATSALPSDSHEQEEFVMKKLWAFVALLVVISMLAACGAAPEPEVVEVEKIVTQVVEVEKEVEKIVTEVVEVEKEVKRSSPRWSKKRCRSRSLRCPRPSPTRV